MNRNPGSPLPHWGPDGTNADASGSFTASQPASLASLWYVQALHRRRLLGDVPRQWCGCYERSSQSMRQRRGKQCAFIIITLQPHINPGVMSRLACRPRTARISGQLTTEEDVGQKLSCACSSFDSGNSELKGRTLSHFRSMFPTLKGSVTVEASNLMS